MKPRVPQQSGFTLIEMIVSLGLFSIVVTIAVGALLVLVSTNERLQEEQSVMTNLSFALDSMTREIRTGQSYFCESLPGRNVPTPAPPGPPVRLFQDGDDISNLERRTQDCTNGNNNNRPVHGLAFIEGGQSVTGQAGSRIVYFFDEDERKIYRRLSGEDAQSIVSSGIDIVNAEFFVSGSAPLSDGSSETDQASVTIVIEAREADDTEQRVYRIQTTVTQRTLDI